MGLQQIVGERGFGGWRWLGSVRGLVDAVGDGDARLGMVIDNRSGAKIALNISGTDDPEATEPFDIESPDGQNLYEASDRREAVAILSNIRRGERYPDMPSKSRGGPRKPRLSRSRKMSPPPSVSGVRR